MMHQQDDMGQFELFLQDSLKDFRMVAGKRVWSSLYNNLHPSRRWPAFSTVVLFVCCLSFFDQNPRAIDVKPIAQAQIHNPVHISLSNQIELTVSRFDQKKKMAQQIHATKVIDDKSNQHNKLSVFASSGNISTTSVSQTEVASIEDLVMNAGIIHPAKLMLSASIGSHPSPIFKPIKLNQINPIAQPTIESDSIQDAKQQTSKFGIAYTITPSIGYRVLKHVSGSSGLFPVSDFNQGDKDFYQKPTMNMEVGALLSYKLNKKISLLSGIQLNYMGYRIEATEWEEPIAAELEYRDQNTGEIRFLNATSTLAKVTNGSKVRHNYSVDLSIPIGLRLTLLDEKKWQFQIQGSLQPGLKISDKTAMISANQSSYIYEPKMVNQWSLFAGMAMQVSIPVDDKLRLNFGPSVRYQLSRQFQSSFVYRENRYNAGLNISLLKSF